MRGKMPGAPLILGPFPGGINNRTDEASIQDSELNECVNFIYGIDGTLIGRYPITEGPVAGLDTITEALRVLGATVMYDTTFNTHAVVIASGENDGTWIYEAGLWEQVSTNKYEAFIAYGNQDNKLFFASDPDDPTDVGGVWAHGDTSITERSTTPAGSTMALHKERIWLAGDPEFPSRLHYTVVTPTGVNADWVVAEDGAGFIDVDPGNGQGIVAIKAFADAIVIFKDDSTYVLSYDGNIARGQLIQVNNDIGTENNLTVVEYQNILAVYHEGKVYAYGNGSFQCLNDKFRFLSDTAFVANYTDPISLSVINDFLLLRHYDKIYIYSFITGGWSEWETDFPVGNFVQLPVFVGDETKTFFITSIDQDDTNVYKMKQEWNTTDSEDFTCSVRTKVFNFDAPYAYKRLFWWGIEALTNMAVTGRASPVSATYIPTWGEVATHTWGEMALGSWGAPFTSMPDVVTGPIDENPGVINRRMYKFLKGLRFREISFTVELASDGTSTNGPPRLLSIVPILKSAEIVVKQVS